MKKLIVIGLAIVSINLQAANNVSWSLVEALRQVESGGRNVYGDHGTAMGQWQFRAIAWRDVNLVRARHRLVTYSYGFAWRERVARVYAHDLLEILRGRFITKARREPSIAELWAVWNIGLSRFFNKYGGDFDKCPRTTQLKAAAVENIVRRIEK